MGNRVFCIGELLIDMICVDNKGLKDGEKFDIYKYSKYIDTFTTDNFKVIFENGEPRLGFNHDGDHAFVSLNDDNSLEYKVSKKVKMLLPQRAMKK